MVSKVEVITDQNELSANFVKCESHVRDVCRDSSGCQNERYR